MVPQTIRKTFAGIQDDLARLSDLVREIIFDYCAKNGYAYIGRLKTVESLAEKIETGRFAKWSDLDDMFACAIVIPTLSPEATVLAFLRSTFAEAETKLRGSSLKRPEEFRFDATRFIGRLVPPLADRGTKLMYTLKFEVQIRSAFEHAWQSATHSLYKGKSVTWKSQRLAAQLKAAVEQLDSLVQSFEASSQYIVEHRWPELEAKRAVVEKFSGFAADGLIPDVVLPKDWTRFSTNLYNLVRAGKGVNNYNVPTKVAESVDCIERELLKRGDVVPLSLSLLQFVFGVLSRDRLLVPPLNGYVPLVTDNLQLFYPETASFVSRFMIEA